MSEVIRAILEADSSDFQAEISKASAAVASFEKTSRRARDVGLPIGGNIDAASFRQMENAAFVARNLSGGLQDVRKSGYGAGAGLLQVAQLADDAQYGLRGVLNNIPGVVLGLGGSVGIAGAFSLATLAAYGAYRAFQRFSGTDSMVKWAETSANAVKAFTQSLHESRMAQEQADKAAAASAALASRRSLEGDQIQRGIGIDPSRFADLEREAAALRRARAAQDAVIAASSASPVTGETATDQGNREWLAARLRFTLDQRRATEDLATAQETLNRIAADYQRIQANQNDKTAQYQSERKELEAQATAAKDLIRAREAELARDQPLLDSGSLSAGDAARTRQRIAENKAVVAEQKTLLSTLQQEIALREQLAAQATEQLLNSRADLDAKRDTTQETIKALREQQRAQAELAQAEAQAIQFRALQKQEGDLSRGADTAQSQLDNVNALADELQILRTTLAEGKAKGDQLREEIQLRKEAAQLAKDTGLSETEATALLKERNEALKQLGKDQPTGTIRERREARSAERAAERERKRNERVQEAERKRKEKGPDGKPVDDKPANDLDALRRAAEEKARKAQEDLNKNIGEQTKIQKSIEEKLKNLATA